MHVHKMSYLYASDQQNKMTMNPLKKITPNEDLGVKYSGLHSTNSTRPSLFVQVRNTLGHNNACAPTAMVAAMGNQYSYQEINNWLKQTGVRPNDNHGTYTGRANLKALGFEIQTLGQFLSVAKFARLFNQGSFLVTVNKHALAIVNGVIMDTTMRYRRAKIYAIYKFNPQTNG